MPLATATGIKPNVSTCIHCNKFKSSNRRQMTAHFRFCKIRQKKFKEALVNQYKEKQAEEEKQNVIFDDNSFDGTDNGTIDSYIENPATSDAFTADESMCKKYSEIKQQTCKELTDEDGDYKAGMKLLGILRHAKAPLETFKKIVDWAVDARINHGVKFDASTNIKRNKTLEKAKSRYNMMGIKPEILPYQMKQSKDTVAVVRFNAKECLYSLYSDPMFKGPKHRLPITPEDNTCFEDINTGETFQNGVFHYIGRDSSTKELIGIILFIDKTYTDVNGRLKLEPVMMTLTCFNSETRKNPLAWRTIGYVTDFIGSKSEDYQMKLQDWHDIVSIILDPIRDMQQNKHLIEVDGVSKELVCPILCVLGDTEGHDKMCGRYAARGSIKYLCRICRVHKDVIDDPFHDRAPLTTMKEIKKLSKANKDDVLKESYSMHCVENAFHDLQFFDEKGGIHQSTPPEVLHVMQQGLHQYLVIGLFGQRKEKKTTKKAKAKKKEEMLEKMDEEEYEKYFDPEQMNLGKNFAFPASVAQMFEENCHVYGKLLARQSDRDLPRTNFFQHIHLQQKKWS